MLNVMTTTACAIVSSDKGWMQRLSKHAFEHIHTEIKMNVYGVVTPGIVIIQTHLQTNCKSFVHSLKISI